ncbi:hypothetical protein IFM89_006422 [Coptis chinensis]|uniref:Uncharacterized protein n=1 Tax=Coptis chinensis TaxID=261450 RepID=A0A835HU85_9MAGN|nr:hypothetical protein IFM89_006422 [Coptis chinensis]
MKHRGAWRDPNGEECSFPEDDRRCMSIYKGGMIGYNETYFTEWPRNVLNDVKINKMEEASKRREIKHQVKKVKQSIYTSPQRHQREGCSVWLETIHIMEKESIWLRVEGQSSSQLNLNGGPDIRV